ncbi:hypothetical protein CYLTODRAFT_420602 [Cylindrobasidium torrendii FP15055 ss-10]|uniref:Spindle pole body component n=1 Tax=Cylindrobasidium torrendii FP15055 ss-10 TaxID=1314674 RepID=A0A0D7BHE2_9AGAR|nr:hypothetical protein CYLTODRAFT_420602 [Cylindrobasidium torrendii FP15055 ss-10]
MSKIFAFPWCEELDEEFYGYNTFEPLQPVDYGFFIPRLDEKPQNPIMDTIKRDVFSDLPLETIALTASALDLGRPLEPLEDLGDDIWAQSQTHKPPMQDEILSWDNLNLIHKKPARSTPFLTEQESSVFAAARHHIQPRLYDPNLAIIHITSTTLCQNLRLTICGSASQLHTWDSNSERFVQVGLQDGRRGRILVDGRDEAISESILSPFIRIGTLLRRLEILLNRLGSRSFHTGPTIHAFDHALSTVLSYLRGKLSTSPLATQLQSQISAKLISQYAAYESILVALSDMCLVNETKNPNDYGKLEIEPRLLLSHIYDHLHSQFERQPNRTVVGIIAYILTLTSEDYLRSICHSIGFGKPSVMEEPLSGDGTVAHTPGELESVEANVLNTLASIGKEVFPKFFPPELVQSLPAAQKSLVLLRGAQSDHPILEMQEGRDIQWFWREEDFQRHTSRRQDMPEVLVRPFRDADDPFAQFSVFNLDPGEKIGSSCFDNDFTAASTSRLEKFIDDFPDNLPLITPTLSHLTSVVFAPLLEHASALSSALLDLFLRPFAQLHLHTHIKLLHSYLLLGSPEFRARLNGALFSDKEDADADERVSLHSMRHRQRKHRPKDDAETVWAVGLAATLLDRDAWPPIGGDLSFFLRTVIVDTFEAAMARRMHSDAMQGALEELDNRLGFAIRDLPVGRGRDRWLNPLAVEAFDFLYMEYRPPHPMEVLITPEIMAKYQRMFTFLLRLTRVENALAAVFRMTRASDAELFPTFTPSRKLLLHLRFLAQTFIASLSQYTFVTAIDGNMGGFLARLDPNAPTILWNGLPAGFRDVFALADAHSELLDDMLSACVMRSTQRAAGEQLRDVFQAILDFSTFVGRMRRGQMKEYEGVPIVEELAEQLKSTISIWMKTIRGMVDKHATQPQSMPLREGQRYIPRPPGGIQALSYLIVQWDASDWWGNFTAGNKQS